MNDFMCMCMYVCVYVYEGQEEGDHSINFRFTLQHMWKSLLKFSTCFS